VAQAYNPSFSGGRDQEDGSSKPPQKIVLGTLAKKKKKSQLKKQV
jgi:hypothetical protein